ncbi:MAG TPA: hypothetical protein VFZ18_00790 [Longimicrobiaceae bacterium]
MFRTLALMLLAVAIGMLVAPRVVIPALTWVLAFLSLLMAADLVRSAVRRRRRVDGVARSAR